MNLFIYCQKDSLTSVQVSMLKARFENVKIINQSDFGPLFKDEGPKVLALDPDIVGWKFPNDIIDQIPNLKAICLQTTGYEWVDCDYCSKKGIVVTNVPHYATNSVAEKCVMMALALAKKLPLFEREGKMTISFDALLTTAINAIDTSSAIGLAYKEFLQNNATFSVAVDGNAVTDNSSVKIVATRS